jgi:hypothetical protein
VAYIFPLFRETALHLSSLFGETVAYIFPQ